MKRQRENDYWRHGYVSIWLGNFGERKAFDMYLGGEEVNWEWEIDWQEISPFCQELGLSSFNLGTQRDFDKLKFRFNDFSLPIGELLRDFPGFPFFCEQLLERCQSLGLDSADTVICLYDLDYEPWGTFAFDRLRFMGAFQFQRESR